MPEPTEVPTDPRAAKAALRADLRRRLAALDPAAAERAAAALADRLLALPAVAAADSLLICFSFGGEIDTWRLADRLLAAGRRLYVPRAEPADRSLHLHPYPGPLETLSFGLRQPPRGTPELPRDQVDRTIDAALVLGLGFDRHGNRLGYGRGYFDRFLAGRPFPAIGIAHHCQLVDRVPVEPHDVPMAAVVTDEEAVVAG